MPETWDTCPICGGPAELVAGREGTTYMRARARSELDELTWLRDALRRAHDALDVKHGHTGETWHDRQCERRRVAEQQRP